MTAGRIEDTLRASGRALSGQIWAAIVKRARLVRGLRLAACAVLVSLVVAGCGYTDFQRLDEQVALSWRELLLQYEGRSELVPRLLAAAGQESSFEPASLNRLLAARSRASDLARRPGLIDDPEAFNRFQKVEGELGTALGRVMSLSEEHPHLRAQLGFRELRVGLAGSEHRIAQARRRYVKAVREYNLLARSFPSSLTAMAFSYPVRPNLSLSSPSALEPATAGERGAEAP